MQEILLQIDELVLDSRFSGPDGGRNMARLLLRALKGAMQQKGTSIGSRATENRVAAQFDVNLPTYASGGVLAHAVASALLEALPGEVKP